MLDFLESSIELLVLLQYGASPLLESLECTECTCQKEYGCALGKRPIEYAEEPLYINFTESEYLNCPMSLIPPIIYQMYDKYAFIKEFNTPLNENETSSLFWWFTKTYKRISNKVQDQIRKENANSK